MVRFLRPVAAFALCLAVGCANPADPDTRLRIGFIGPDSTRLDPWRGAELGAEEIRYSADLLGWDVEVLMEQAPDSAAAADAARRMIDRNVDVLIGGDEAASCRALAHLAERHEVLFLNTGCADDALRGFGRLVFHVHPSESQFRAAAGTGTLARIETNVTWHGALARYGAAQLNRRFAERFGHTAEGGAWAAWLGFKIAWEAFRAAGDGSATSLRSHLLDATTEFDGHKGAALRFESGTRQLLQPLFPAPRSDVTDFDTRPREIVVDGVAELRRAAARNRRLAIVTNEGSSDLSILDADAGTRVARVSLPSRPRGVRTDGGTRVFVAISDDAPATASDVDAIIVIDLASGAVESELRAGTDPEQFALSADGRKLYAANEDAGTATVTDLATGTVLATLIVGIEPEGVAASTDGRWVYVTAETSNTVTVLDARADSVVSHFLVGARPRAAVFSPDGQRAFVTNEIGGSVSVVDVRRHVVVSTIPLDEGGAKPVGVTVSPDGRRLYVANGHAGTLSVIDTRTLEEVATIQVGRRPWGVAVSSDGAFVYTANGGSDDVSVVDAATLQVVNTIRVGSRPWGIAVTR